jgi:hypothetical protein
MMRRFLAALAALSLFTTQALAGFVLNWIELGPATITFLQCAEDATDQTTYTFSTQNTGTASGDRTTIIAVHAEDTNADFGLQISSVTVGGDTASIQVQTDTVANDVLAGIATISNPSGTSEDVVVTMSEGVTSVNICLYRANSLRSITATDTARASEAGAVDVDVDTTADGIVVAAANDAGSPSYTWVGVTERYDGTGTESSGTGGSFDEDSTPETPRAINVDDAAPGGFPAVAAAFR